MSEKIFEGQYAGEKILLRIHPNLAFFFLQNMALFWSYIFISVTILLIGIFAFPKNILIFSLISVLFIVIFGFHFWHLYREAKYTFTSRRLIFFVKKSLFKRSYNEIHLVDLRAAVPKKSGLFGAIFGYGTLIVTDKDEKKIIYPGMSEHKFVARYLGRVIDYIKIHGHTDNISRYQPRKIRKEMKKNNEI